MTNLLAYAKSHCDLCIPREDPDLPGVWLVDCFNATGDLHLFFVWNERNGALYMGQGWVGGKRTDLRRLEPWLVVAAIDAMFGKAAA